MPSIRLHLAIMIACEFMGFIVAALCVGALWFNDFFGDGIVWVSTIGFIAILAGTMFPRFVFRNLIPARCGQEYCGGHAYAIDSQPIKYLCRDCGMLHETNASDGGNNMPNQR